MAIVHLCGFGTYPTTGDYVTSSNATNGTSTWSRQTGRSSGYALRHSSSTSGSSESTAGRLNFPSNLVAGDFSIGFALNHRAAWTPSGSGLTTPFGFGLANASGTSSLAVYFGTGVANNYDRAGGFGGAWTTLVGTANTIGWHYWCMVFKFAATTGYLRVYRDGAAIAESVGTTNGSSLTQMRLALGNNNGGAQVDVGDLIIRNDATLIPDQQVITLFPSSTSAAAWVGSDGNSTNNELLVNESPDYNAATYVGSATVNALDTYVMADLPGTAASVAAVQATARAGKSDAGAKTMATIINAAQGTAADPGGAGTIYQVAELNGGSAWDTAAVNAVTLGIKVVT